MYRSLPFKSDSLIRTVVMVVSRNETGKSPVTYREGTSLS